MHDDGISGRSRRYHNGGRIFNNFRYADDAAFISDNEAELQKIISRLNETCKDYGMEINAKKQRRRLSVKQATHHVTL